MFPGGQLSDTLNHLRYKHLYDSTRLNIYEVCITNQPFISNLYKKNTRVVWTIQILCLNFLYYNLLNLFKIQKVTRIPKHSQLNQCLNLLNHVCSNLTFRVKWRKMCTCNLFTVYILKKVLVELKVPRKEFLQRKQEARKWNESEIGPH